MNHLYILKYKYTNPRSINPRMWWIFYTYKVGISTKPDERLSDISRDVRNLNGFEVEMFFKYPMFLASIAEGVFKKYITRYLRNYAVQGTTGWSEWLTWPNAITALFLFLVLPESINQDFVSAFCLTVMAVPLPLDVAVFCGVLWLIEIILLNIFLAGLTGVNLVKQTAWVMRLLLG